MNGGNVERYFDVCDQCGSRELEFVFFDLMRSDQNAWVKDIPGYRCRECGELLVSSGAIETIDEIVPRKDSSVPFPILKYQKRVLKGMGIERDFIERLLHAWSIVKIDGRQMWEFMGARTFGDISNFAI
jgi:hypothetical protein